MQYAVGYYSEVLGAHRLWIYPQDNHFELGKLIFWEDEYKFCQQLMEDINSGVAMIEIKNDCLVLRLGNQEKRELLFNRASLDDEKGNEALKNSLQKLSRTGLLAKAEPGGMENTVFASVAISFYETLLKESEEEKPANGRFKKRTKIKLAKSAGRRWTEPKKKPIDS